jgi:hypothetical protein
MYNQVVKNRVYSRKEVVMGYESPQIFVSAAVAVASFCAFFSVRMLANFSTTDPELGQLVSNVSARVLPPLYSDVEGGQML